MLLWNAVRILQHIIGITAVKFVVYNYSSFPRLLQTYTAFYDLGLYFIVIDLFRALG